MRTLNLKAPLDVTKAFVAEKYQSNGSHLLRYWNGQFFSWRITHYKEVSKDLLRKEIYEYLDSKFTDSGEKAHPKTRNVSEVVDALQAVTFVDEVRTPVWLNKETTLDPSGIISCRNGLLHIPSRQLLPHSPEFFNLNSIECIFDPNAGMSEQWAGFMSQVWPEDLEAASCLQEWFGLLLTLDTSHQKALMIVGPSRSGKGTIGRVLRALVGNENTCSPTFAGLGQHFGVSSLIGKQLALISDARLGRRTDIDVVAETILRITGEDAISVARKHLSDWIGNVPVRFVIFTNEVPALADVSGALANRFIVLRMTRSFLGVEDTELSARLLSELPGILNWALDGLDRINTTGRLSQPTSASQTLELLHTISSPISSFVADECVLDPQSDVVCSALYEHWKAWCIQQGREHPGTAQLFGRNLSAAFPQLGTDQRRLGSRRPRFYMGIRLRTIGDIDT